MAGPNERSLLNDALRIWRAGVAAVAPERLLGEAIRLDGSLLTIETTRGDGVDIDLSNAGRVIVVGGGKAGAGMARGFEAALAPLVEAGRVEGLLSVPANCVGLTQAIQLVGGRPAGVNEPRPEGAAATAEMLRLVSTASRDDVVICLLSGGGSALMPSPAEGLTLDDKIAVAKLLAAAGATIDELNTVRQHLSRFKGGGLARACRAGRLVTLVISDVLGDPLDLIASGPTVEPRSTPADALAVLKRLRLSDEPRLARVVSVLRSKVTEKHPRPTTDATTLVLANNATAVDAAGVEAERLGYSHAMDCARHSEGPAEEVGRHLAQMALRMRDAVGANEPDCLITGGEPTVTLAPSDIRGKGGRNQQLVLAALQELHGCRDVALVSGGTDGEDGPTDVAGAMIDEGIASKLAGADLADTLRRNDAYPLFSSVDALLKTGPTNTNVCDLRVVTVSR